MRAARANRVSCGREGEAITTTARIRDVTITQPMRLKPTSDAFLSGDQSLYNVESRCGAVADAPVPHPAHRTRHCGFPASGSRTRRHGTQGPVGRRLRILNV